jgi:hypothetical protein
MGISCTGDAAILAFAYAYSLEDLNFAVEAKY